MLRTLICAALLAIATAACETPVCGCPPADDDSIVDAHFRGYVLSPDSVGIGGATIAPEIGVTTCDTAHDRVWSDSTTSEHGGFFAGAAIAADTTLGALCIRLRALPPDSTPYLPSDFVHFTVGELPELGPITLNLYLTAP